MTREFPDEIMRELEKGAPSSTELKELLDAADFVAENVNLLEGSDRINPEKIWKTLSEKINRHERARKIARIFWSAAASLIIFVTSFFTVSFFLRGQRPGKPVEEIVDVYSAEGTVTRIILPDSSVVILNSGSHIQYAKNFTSEQKRDVRLNGEAYFKVSHDPDRPFEVSVWDALRVTALGTEFDVRSYDTDSSIDVTLASGKVELAKGNKKYYMLPGQIARAKKDIDSECIISEANIYERIAWIDGKLVFRRAKLKDIVNQLSRNFNAEIILRGSEIENYEYSATFKDESLEDILSLLEMTAPIKIKVFNPQKRPDDSFSKKRVIISLK